MSESESSESRRTQVRDQLLGRFEKLTSQVEAALNQDDVDEVTSLLSYRAQALAALIDAAAQAPFPQEVITRLQARDTALQERLETGQANLTQEASNTRAKGRAARLYAKNSK